MSNSIHLISLLLLASGLSIHAQEKRAMTFDEMVGWERISEQRISDNGKWVFCKHKERDTFEVHGGHREFGEDIIETAKRELQ